MPLHAFFLCDSISFMHEFCSNHYSASSNYHLKAAVKGKSDTKSKDISLNNLKATVQTDQIDLSQHDDKKSRSIMHRYKTVLPRCVSSVLTTLSSTGVLEAH